MKTLRNCQDRIAQRFGLSDWGSAKKKERGSTMHYFQLAAELYGRYCRFAGHLNGKQTQTMKAKELYPNIAFFLTLKELPNCPVGSMVTISDADGRECLWCNSIQMPLDTAKLAPDWFSPVTHQEHIQMIKDNFYKYWVSLGKSEEEIKAAWDIL